MLGTQKDQIVIIRQAKTFSEGSYTNLDDLAALSTRQEKLVFF
jgi:hypothetical protein